MNDNFNLASASEFSLTIALVVFVMITLFLIAIIVLLLLSKSFRAFFFREHKNAEPVPPRTEKDENAEAPLQHENTAESKSDAPECKQPKRRKKPNDPFGVPTVPLTLNAADPTPVSPKSTTKKKSEQSTLDGIKTVDIGRIAAQSDKTTYITRTLPKNNNGKSRKQR